MPPQVLCGLVAEPKHGLSGLLPRFCPLVCGSRVRQSVAEFRERLHTWEAGSVQRWAVTCFVACTDE